jgi:hypothetical protein
MHGLTVSCYFCQCWEKNFVNAGGKKKKKMVFILFFPTSGDKNKDVGAKC